MATVNQPRHDIWWLISSGAQRTTIVLENFGEFCVLFFLLANFFSSSYTSIIAMFCQLATHNLHDNMRVLRLPRLWTFVFSTMRKNMSTLSSRFGHFVHMPPSRCSSEVQRVNIQLQTKCIYDDLSFEGDNRIYVVRFITPLLSFCCSFNR